ncbi:HDOD domain-containing protein [Motilimonas cestriensis]|uniref:HDOD domain-containing protein n=1 Tax=Motilimonas cestriensis TaxID=2742685 RepID=A0ABS8WAD1_9GAMM|nr:HDOD domain-containing protein [Motilimonas cestriensis]MCE2595996.1 HDOD domain-containing protein [Motilimonas cestriensis]
MSCKGLFGQEAWIRYISENEMPVLRDTVAKLEQIAKDDTASLSQLGQAILHDHGLTARILRIANSACYNRGRQQVTTVSRAVVMLGFKAIKQICITAQMLDTLLADQRMDPNVYQRLVLLIARSLLAGMLVKKLLHKSDADTQEEYFLAALMRRLGEAAFWRSNSDVAIFLDEKLRFAEQHHKSTEYQHSLIRDLLGTSFERMSQGLAASWHLGSTVEASLADDPENNYLMRALLLADGLSAELISMHPNGKKKQQYEAKIGQLLGVGPQTVEKEIQSCQQGTIELMHAYGAGRLVKYLNVKDVVLPAEADSSVSNEALQLKILHELTNMAVEKVDINMVMHSALEGIYRGIGMDTVLIFMLTRDRRGLKPRFVSGKDSVHLKDDFEVAIGREQNLFTHCLQSFEPIWCRSHHDKWQRFISAKLLKLTPESGFFIAPLAVEKRSIGLVYADRKLGHIELEETSFVAFQHFVQQTNLCLTKMMHPNG